MPASNFQPSFAAGVIAPGLHGRIDINKYDVGLKVGENVFIHTHGGVSNRAGTEFIAEVWDSAQTYRLIPFSRDEDDNYVMVLGDQAMQIVFDGAWVETSPDNPYQPPTPYAAADVADVDYVQSVDVMYFTHVSYRTQLMSRTALTSWTFADLLFNPTAPLPTNVVVTPDGPGAETYTYKVAAVVNGTEGFPSIEATTAAAQNLDISGAQNVITWDAVAGAEEYVVYRERGGSFGYIGFADGTTFTDDNIDPNLELSPVQSTSLFQAAGDYPSKCTLYQQRLMLAATQNDPESVWGSRIGDFQNFTRSRFTRDDERVEVTLSGESINRVRSLLPLRDLVAFTWAGEIAITGPDGGLPATNPIQTQNGRAGAWYVKPIVVDDTAIFVDRTGRTVRDLRYAFEQDGYAGNELTIFAQHYFDGRTIQRWGFAQSPFSVIWVALDDGTLLSFTYKREHQVWAWARHDLGGLVEDICVIPENGEDAVYFLVRRTVQGTQRRYIERMKSRLFTDQNDAFFVDSGITYDGPETTTITGLDHLEGETVTALADGSVVPTLTVSGGQVSLPVAAAKVHVGLPFEAEIETLPPAITLRDIGSARGRPTRTPKVRIQLERTRGIEASSTNRDFAPLLRQRSDLSQVPELVTGMVDIGVGPGWSKDGTIVIRQPYPLPMTVLGIAPEVVIGRTD